MISLPGSRSACTTKATALYSSSTSATPANTGPSATSFHRTPLSPWSPSVSPSGYRPSSTPYQLGGLEPHALWRMIHAEHPTLPREHRQLVVDVADGNAKLAKLLVDHIAS
jgi:hypothetical protein